MALITLCGVKQAKRGFRFLHLGATEACEGCGLLRVCAGNLERGRVYEVTALRQKLFPCALHEGGVRVVEVEEAALQGVLEPKKAILGVTVVFQPQPCDRRDCPNHGVCHPVGLFPGERCNAIRVGGKIACPERRDLREALLKRVKG